MNSSSQSLAHDLALKRTVHAPFDQKPHYAWRDVIASENITVPSVVLLCPHGEERFVLAEVADTLGKALTNVALAKGDKDIFTDSNRAWVVRLCREITANLTELARSQNPLRLSLNTSSSKKPSSIITPTLSPRASCSTAPAKSPSTVSPPLSPPSASSVATTRSYLGVSKKSKSPSAKPSSLSSATPLPPSP